VASAYDIVGFVYEAGYHCEACTEKRFGRDALDNLMEYGASVIDSEENEVTPLFNHELRDVESCEDCHELLA
jgi:hypothetical protein